MHSQYKSKVTVVLFLLLCHSAFAQELVPRFSVSDGTLITHSRFPSHLIEPRDVHVWLPPGFNKQRRYDVLYMQDGQMLFDASQTWNNQEWGIDEVASKLIKENSIRPFILVAIENISAQRFHEYFPQKALNYIEKNDENRANPLFSIDYKADRYLKFLVNELKPYIDKNYPTNPVRDATFIGGSSMGGLISLYALSEYPEVIANAICISTHWVGAMPGEKLPLAAAIRNYLDENLPPPGSHRLYFDYGDQTLDAHYPPLQNKVDELLLRHGYSDKNWITQEFSGHAHDEQSWNSRLHIPLLFMFGI